MPIDNKNLEVIGCSPLHTDTDVIAEAARYHTFMKAKGLPGWRERCEMSEKKLARWEELLSDLREDQKTLGGNLEDEIEEVERMVARLLEAYNMNLDKLIAMENAFMKLSQILGYLEARSAGLDLSVRVDITNIDVPPGIRPTDFAQWEARREYQLVAANIQRVCIAELRHLLATVSLDVLDS
ncbi:hypothetical protein VSDG_09462 [Cytospora chrysosperma]|uniref:Uncharacterized protein n=1 Tax=Cytospora chrysosperma TaxID=252740 RepID=A0A423VAP9_CYTCH|nr:hypothetical protein VSDG_09462 [Valsa sordida]